MKKIGISIYPSKSEFEQDKTYLDLAHKYGFTRIFTSLLEIEGDGSEIIEKYKRIIEYGNKLGMETMLDINPKLFGQLGVSYDDLSFFKSFGASGIRLDLGFSGAEEALMTKNEHGLKIEVNMSSGTKYIDNVMSYCPNREHLLASQNFYPQRYSGLAHDHFEQTTAQYNDYRLNTAAFITSQVGELGPWEMQDGLCTLESHRTLPIELQIAHYKLMDTIDDVLIGNAYASEEELRKVSEIFHSPHHLLPIVFNKDATELERKVILNEVHSYRGDRSTYMIRSTQTRVKYKEETFPVGKTDTMQKGDVVIGNDTFGQYKGETQVVIQEMEDDGTRNIVGTVQEDALFLLDYLEPWTSFKFIER
ncbi:hypothetical protein SAMN04488100_12137 [Alkalibacterium putridalgicola]|uniref:Outer surface protein n=1 Tax=Alkalibacterium putridalgicola TaxID=426703 RepID=A0A1H7V2U5_9LACT|nr:MupG family TIM beta-alpha barrel fold protein [Alkalibacterium putridalgicola]GEK89669.1 hypothetical protein APU01nite_17080 [Alkalibacterium putridalgicola]SEM03464.1 hypothetical protein SAMN04488100_12137 [Alkalibacterium putridalgicola]